MKILNNITVFFLFIFVLLSCSDDNTSHIEPPKNNSLLEIPSYFPETTYRNIVITQEGIDLGRKLFKDINLSTNGSSCQTCHLQSFAFTHHGHQFSSVHSEVIGEGGGEQQLFTDRNSQPLFNLAFLKEFTWDGAVTELQGQPKIPLEAKNEMNAKEDDVIAYLQALDKGHTYVEEFEKAFDKTENEDHVVNKRTFYSALSQYMLTLISANSKYDKVRRGEAAYTVEEKKGLDLFNQKCATCHPAPLFTDQSYRNNGLELDTRRRPDEIGRARATDESSGKASPDFYKFRVPSLRNVEWTYPYMHDGRLAESLTLRTPKDRLRDVLDFYDSDTKAMKRRTVANTPNLDPYFVLGDGKYGIEMTEEEKDQIIAFLLTLTDEEFLDKEF